MDQFSSKKENFCFECDSEFDDVTHFEAHKQQKYCTNITALDGICMDIIFKYLSFNDLAAFSSTCKHYKELAERYFYLNCDPEPIRIGSFGKTIKFCFKSSEKYAYERNFSSLIRSICVYGDRSVDVNPFSFINGNCAKDLKSLKMFGLRINLNGSKCCQINGKMIENQLKHLKELKLLDCNGMHYELLKYCANLQTLTILVDHIGESTENDYESTWTNKMYPNLKSFTLCVPYSVNIDLTNFLKLNRNLKRIICSNISAIKSICSAENKFEYAALVFHPEDNDQAYLSVQNDIVDWCKRECCKQLELGIRFYDVTEVICRSVIGLQNLIAIHFCMDEKRILPETINILAPNITKLCIVLSDDYMTNDRLDEIDKFFPNLNELNLKITTSSIYFENTFKNHVLPIVSRFNHLKYFKFMNMFEMEFSNDDIIELNQARSLLENACDLIIILERQHFDQIQFNESDLSIVQIQPDEDDAFCLLCSYAYYQNPGDRLQCQRIENEMFREDRFL